MIVQPFVGPWPLFQFRNNFLIDGRTQVGLLGRVISPSQGGYLRTVQQKTQNKRTHKHLCLEWDSNPRS
jgi:hypothetical protein